MKNKQMTELIMDKDENVSGSSSWMDGDAEMGK